MEGLPRGGGGHERQSLQPSAIRRVTTRHRKPQPPTPVRAAATHALPLRPTPPPLRPQVFWDALDSVQLSRLCLTAYPHKPDEVSILNELAAQQEQQ